MQVNVDVPSQLHVDGFYIGPSLVGAFGDFVGGELLLDGGEPWDLHGHFVIFNARVPHRALPHRGRR